MVNFLYAANIAKFNNLALTSPGETHVRPTMDRCQLIESLPLSSTFGTFHEFTALQCTGSESMKQSFLTKMEVP